ncbi:MAG TPA: ABC transporter ATP-binding protein [Phycisphaerales bacterium]|nr:ABC transporter ATP-binding protein [Phycisphaerales bacterium]
MAGKVQSSKTRFRQYRKDLRERRRQGTLRGDVTPTTLSAQSDAHAPKKRTRSFFKLLTSFFGLLKGERRALIFALCCLTISTSILLIPPFAPKLVVDYVLSSRPIPPDIATRFHLPTDKRTLLLMIAIALIVVSSVSTFISMLGRWQATRISVNTKPAIRRRIFDRVMHLPLHRVYQIKTGGVSSILREDPGYIGDLVFGMIYNPWRAILQLLGSLAIMAWVDWRLLLGAVIILPTVWLTHRTWINRIRPLYRDIHFSRQTIDSHATEAFGGIRVVRGFGRERSESARFVTSDQFRARQEIHVWWWARTVDIVWALIIPTASAILLWYGGTRVMDGAITIGDLVMFITYLTMLLDPVATLAQSATALQTGLAALDRLLDLLAEPVEMPASATAKIVSRENTQGRITFNNVTFAYPGTDSPVLHEISLDVRPGELIALVGPSGAGKTTLCNLVARFYDPTAGFIALDGTDMRDIDVLSLRRLTGIVEQDIFLFDGSVAENIGYGRRDLDQQAIITAAQAANAHEFISKFEKGYDTIIGERGVKLSGGQRQRLAIARALLADPKILILDEATSNLDTESERLIQHSLQRLMKGRTSFVIAHRLSTITHADRIVVIEGGRIAQTGTHQELMAAGGRYQKMVLLQTELATFAHHEVASIVHA